MNPTVLITTAISPPSDMPFLEMTNPYDRIISTKSAIYFFVSQKVSNIIIADATGKKVLSDHELTEVKQTGVNVEQINYVQDSNEVIKKGKGFAEGLLIKFAIESSEILSKSDAFFKCTGKVFCRNFNEITKIIDTYNHPSGRKITNFFWSDYHIETKFNRVDLRFYYTNKKFFSKILFPAYEQSDDLSGLIAEISCANALNKTLGKGASIRPKLTGFSGGLGNQYDELYLGDLETQFPCFYQLGETLSSNPRQAD